MFAAGDNSHRLVTTPGISKPIGSGETGRNMSVATVGGLAKGAAILATLILFLPSFVEAAGGSGIDGSTILLIEGIVLAVLLVVLIAKDRAED